MAKRRAVLCVVAHSEPFVAVFRTKRVQRHTVRTAIGEEQRRGVRFPSAAPLPRDRRIAADQIFVISARVGGWQYRHSDCRSLSVAESVERLGILLISSFPLCVVFRRERFVGILTGGAEATNRRTH